jgi:hypothetical protein
VAAAAAAALRSGRPGLWCRRRRVFPVSFPAAQGEGEQAALGQAPTAGTWGRGDGVGRGVAGRKGGRAASGGGEGGRGRGAPHPVSPLGVPGQASPAGVPLGLHRVAQA